MKMEDKRNVKVRELGKEKEKEKGKGEGSGGMGRQEAGDQSCWQG
jgi:hypothetical protein